MKEKSEACVYHCQSDEEKSENIQIWMWVNQSRCWKKGWKFVLEVQGYLWVETRGGSEQLNWRSNIWEWKERDSSAGDVVHKGGWKRIGVYNMWVLSPISEILLGDEKQEKMKKKVYLCICLSGSSFPPWWRVWRWRLLLCVSCWATELVQNSFIPVRKKKNNKQYQVSIHFIQQKTYRRMSSPRLFQGDSNTQWYWKTNLIIAWTLCTPRWWGAGEKWADNFFLSFTLPDVKL